MYLPGFEVLFEIVLTIVFCLVSYPFRVFAVLCAKYFEPDLIQIISGTDSRLAVIGPHKSVHKLLVTCVAEGSYPIKKCHEIFQRQILTAKNTNGVFIYERLKWTWKMFMGYPFWRRTDFKLENHIRDYDYTGELSLPDFRTKKDLEVVLGGLANGDWDPDKSPWEILIVNNYHMDKISNNDCSEVKTAFIYCVDHVLMDGFSAFNIMKQVFDLQCTLPNIKLGPPPGTIKQRFLLWMKLPYDYLELIESTRGQRQLAVNPEC
ncbi:unnamed protein product, partial [Allacma fusca]